MEQHLTNRCEKHLVVIWKSKSNKTSKTSTTYITYSSQSFCEDLATYTQIFSNKSVHTVLKKETKLNLGGFLFCLDLFFQFEF